MGKHPAGAHQCNDLTQATSDGESPDSLCNRSLEGTTRFCPRRSFLNIASVGRRSLRLEATSLLTPPALQTFSARRPGDDERGQLRPVRMRVVSVSAFAPATADTQGSLPQVTTFAGFWRRRHIMTGDGAAPARQGSGRWCLPQRSTANWSGPLKWRCSAAWHANQPEGVVDSVDRLCGPCYRRLLPRTFLAPRFSNPFGGNAR